MLIRLPTDCFLVRPVWRLIIRISSLSESWPVYAPSNEPPERADEIANYATEFDRRGHVISASTASCTDSSAAKWSLIKRL